MTVFETVAYPLTVRGIKEAVIREMVESLHCAGYFRDADLGDIVRAVMRREQLGTTGIGRHIAIPHSRHASVDRLIGTLAKSDTGLPFDSLDGEPVYVFVLLVSPQDRPGDHLRALEAVVRTFRNEGQFVPFSLEVDTVVYPGHMGITTLEREVASNPFLAELPAR